MEKEGRKTEAEQKKEEKNFKNFERGKKRV